MTTPAEAVQALVAVRQRIERLEIELEQARAERKRLEEIELPPIFLQAQMTYIELTNGARAQKAPFAYARLAKSGPKRTAMLDWLRKIGEGDAIKNTLIAKWGTGHDEVAQTFYREIMRHGSAEASLGEDVHWRTLEKIVYDQTLGGKTVPYDEIGATFGDRVTLIRNPVEPSADKAEAKHHDGRQAAAGAENG